MSDKIRILYIDDYELDRELVKDALEKEHGGFQVTEASHKREFEALLKTREFDVVLSDFNIAGFEGLQVLEAVRDHDPRIPVIIVTGTGSEEIAVKALKQGAADYVIKRPKHILRLPQTIFAAIEKQALKDQRQEAETALKESEERYRLLVENQNDLFVKFGRGQKLKFVSPSYCETFGVKEENIIGRSFFSLIHEDDMEIVKASIASLEKPPHTTYHEERAKTIDGWRWFGWSLKAKVDDTGNIVEVFSVGRDITDQKRAEEALRERLYTRGAERELDAHARRVDVIERLVSISATPPPALVELT